MPRYSDGIQRDPREDLYRVFVADQHEEMVLVRDIPFYSMCEHHLLPFYGTAHVAYVPDGRVTGLSKLARLVDGFARRPPDAGEAHHPGGPMPLWRYWHPGVRWWS